MNNMPSNDNPLSNDELMLYARQLLLESWDIDAQINLKQAKVLIVGMGGLGCPVAQILSRAGVGYLGLVDLDTIEISNLQRQTLFNNNDIGKPKAQIAKQRLQTDNLFITIDDFLLKIDEHTIHLFNFENFDLVIDCTDNFTIRQLLNKTCRQYNTPLLSNSAIGESGQIALFEQDTGCYCCLFGNQPTNNNTCANSGVLASTVHIVGSMTAQTALHFLGKKINPIKHTLLLWQGSFLSLQKIKFNQKTDCPICANP